MESTDQSKPKSQFFRPLPALHVVMCNHIPDSHCSLHFPVVRVYAVRSLRNYHQGDLLFTFVIGDSTGITDVTCFVREQFSEVLLAKGLFVEIKNASAKPIKPRYLRFYATASPRVVEIGKYTTITTLDMEQVKVNYAAHQLAPLDGSIPSTWFRPMLNDIDERFHAKAHREREELGLEASQFAGYLAMDSNYVPPQNSKNMIPIHGAVSPEIAAMDMFDSGEPQNTREETDEHHVLCGDSAYIANSFPGPMSGTRWADVNLSELKHGMAFQVEDEGKFLGRGVVMLREETIKFVVLKRKQTIEVDKRDIQRSPVGHIHDALTRGTATLHRIPKDEFKQWRKGLHLSMYLLLDLKRPEHITISHGRVPSGRLASVATEIICVGCKESFSSEGKLTLHYKRSSICRAKTNMDDLPNYKCKLCDKLPYINEKRFRNHVTKKHPEATFESALMSVEDLSRISKNGSSIKELAMLPHKEGPYTSSEILQAVSEWPMHTKFDVHYVQKAMQVSTGLFLGKDANGDFVARFSPGTHPFIDKVDFTEKSEVFAVIPTVGTAKSEKRVREEDDNAGLGCRDRRTDLLDRFIRIKEAFKSEAVSTGVELFMDAIDGLQEFLIN